MRGYSYLKGRSKRVILCGVSSMRLRTSTFDHAPSGVDGRLLGDSDFGCHVEVFVGAPYACLGHGCHCELLQRTPGERRRKTTVSNKNIGPCLKHRPPKI